MTEKTVEAPETAAEQVEPAEPTVVFKNGKWFKLGPSAISRKFGEFGINEIFTVTSVYESTNQVVLTNIRGQQTTINKALLDTLDESLVYQLVPIAIGDKFRIPNEEKLKEMGIEMPLHVKERISPGAIIKVNGICNNGSMIEVSLWNGNSFLICPEVLSKFRRKSGKGEKA